MSASSTPVHVRFAQIVAGLLVLMALAACGGAAQAPQSGYIAPTPTPEPLRVEITNIDDLGTAIAEALPTPEPTATPAPVTIVTITNTGTTTTTVSNGTSPLIYIDASATTNISNTQTLDNVGNSSSTSHGGQANISNSANVASGNTSTISGTLNLSGTSQLPASFANVPAQQIQLSGAMVQSRWLGSFDRAAWRELLNSVSEFKLEQLQQGTNPGVLSFIDQDGNTQFLHWNSHGSVTSPQGLSVGLTYDVLTQDFNKVTEYLITLELKLLP